MRELLEIESGHLKPNELNEFPKVLKFELGDSWRCTGDHSSCPSEGSLGRRHGWAILLHRDQSNNRRRAESRSKLAEFDAIGFPNKGKICRSFPKK
jgi:hypothetical protein